MSNDQEHVNKLSSQSRPGQRSSASVKIDTERIDAVLGVVGELVVLKSQLMNETQAYTSNLKLNAIVSLIEKSIRDLQDKALGMRMTPLKSLFIKTQRIARDLSVKLGKPVEFEMSGEETEIDRTMVELLGDPLMHLVRNALDHGIERPEQRAAAGKIGKGVIRLSAQQAGSRVIVKISDDGAGINEEKIIRKAMEKNLVPSTQDPHRLEPQQIYQLIFAPGFSTAEVVSDVSGRGVGMDVVKSNIDKLKGTIHIESQKGLGTTFIISVPLTTSITEGMQIQCAGQRYVLPLDGIRELIDFNGAAITINNTDREIFNARGSLLPVIDLDKVFHTQASSSQTKTIIVVETNKGRIALKVEAVLGQVQVVLKAMGEFFSSAPGIAGAAILGDGKIALVLDVDSLEMERRVS